MNHFKPSVCIDAVFEGVAVDEAIEQVQAAGINAFEFWGWWDKDLDALQEAQQENDLVISACCTKFISLVNPADRSAYIDGVAASIEAAHRLGTDILISQVGDVREDVPRAAQHDSLVEGLREVAPLLEQLGHHHVVAHLLGQSALVLLQLRLTRLHLKPLFVQLGVARR